MKAGENKMIDAGIDLYKAQSEGKESPSFWIAKLLLMRFESGELVGKLGRVEIYTVSENGNHSVFAWVKIAPEDGVDVFLGTAEKPVNANKVLDVWV